MNFAISTVQAEDRCNGIGRKPWDKALKEQMCQATLFRLERAPAVIDSSFYSTTLPGRDIGQIIVYRENPICDGDKS